MISRRGRIVLTYLISSLVLFGMSAFLFGRQEQINQSPIGVETTGNVYMENQKSPNNPEVHEANKASESGKESGIQVDSMKTFQTEEDRIKSELSLVGIESEESSNEDQNQSKENKPKSLRDFPSPIQAVPIKPAGNYYSESLQAYLFHAGTDYAQGEGAVIRVKHPGKVIYAGSDPILGQKVELDCGDDWRVIYGGLEKLRVKEGDLVTVNEAIGQVGYYPNADGVKNRPQLHFEVWHGDEVQIPNVESQ